MKEWLRRYRSEILYVFFGGLTTLVNFAVYYLTANAMGIATAPATAIAWAASVLFAYGTNRRWVFASKEHTPLGVLREMCSFFLFRGLSGLMDIGIMSLCVDLWHWNGLIVKLGSNVLVIVVNYFASKLFIFRDKK